MPTLRLADGSLSGADNYLPLRHLAALLVLYGHSYALSRPGTGESDLIAKLMPGFYAGNLAVYLFFAISGYLVTLSLLRHPSLGRYVVHRFRRVYPAYVACLLACVFVLGAALTTLPLGEYFRAPGTWQYLLRNLQPVSLAWELPGVFEHNPYPKVVNGTLWSLGLEVRWYFYLALLAALTIVRRRWAFTTLASLLLALGAWEWWSGKPDINDYRTLSQTFLLAALCAHWREHIRVSHWFMAGIVVACALGHGSRWFGPAVVLGAVYATFWVAYRLPALPWPRHVDYSYGLFLYGFPVQQTLLVVIPSLTPAQVFATSTAGALACAALSWHLIEFPVLRPGRQARTESPTLVSAPSPAS